MPKQVGKPNGTRDCINEDRIAAETAYEDAMFGDHSANPAGDPNPLSLLEHLGSPRPTPESNPGHTATIPIPVPIPVPIEPVTYERRGGISLPADTTTVCEIVPLPEQGRFDLAHSLGHQFAESWARRPQSDAFGCFNQSRGSSTFGRAGSDNFHLGQVVWLVRHNSPQGWSLIAEGDGPFVIVEYHFSRCMLVDKNGNIFPKTVHSRFLMPYTSTWSAVRIPEALRNHPEVQRLLSRNPLIRPNYFRYN
ncbi:hypothetical protein JOM56_007381 [Amanita muscaria]